jgi:hypothetical protein
MNRRSNVGNNNRRRSGGNWRLQERIETKNNIHMTMRERGKIVGRRESHNIWLNLGREYLASLLDYISFSPLTPERNDRIAYMGVGIGGNQQVALTVANSAPIVTAYPGTNNQSDTDPTVTALERPVRISGGSLPYPGSIGDLWLGQVQAPAVHGTATQVTFSHLFGETDISYNPFLVVPLSEIMLFTYAANPNVFNNTGVAYDTFPTISKTNAFSLEVDWTVLF